MNVKTRITLALRWRKSEGRSAAHVRGGGNGFLERVRGEQFAALAWEAAGFLNAPTVQFAAFSRLPT